MSAPFMQLYVADYLGDTQHLTTEQHGAYLLILMAMWRQGGALPNDDRMLARIARVSARRWHLMSAEVMAFFAVENGQVTQKRLVEEYQKAVSKSEKRSASGKLGGEAKALKTKETGLANAKQMPKHSSKPDIRTRDNPSTPNGVSPPTKRGTRVDAFQPDEAVGIEIGLSPEQSHREAEKFRDYFLGAPGQKGVKQDWPATWRNWARRAFENLPRHSTQRGPHEQRNSHTQRRSRDDDLRSGVSDVFAAKRLRDADRPDEQGDWAERFPHEGRRNEFSVRDVTFDRGEDGAFGDHPRRAAGYGGRGH